MIKPLQTCDGVLNAFNQALAVEGCEECRVHLLEKVNDTEAQESKCNWKIGGGGFSAKCPKRCHEIIDKITDELRKYDVIWPDKG